MDKPTRRTVTLYYTEDETAGRLSNLLKAARLVGAERGWSRLPGFWLAASTCESPSPRSNPLQPRTHERGLSERRSRHWAFVAAPRSTERAGLPAAPLACLPPDPLAESLLSVCRATNQGPRQSKREEAAPHALRPSAGAAKFLWGSGGGGSRVGAGGLCPGFPGRGRAARRPLARWTPQDWGEGRVLPAWCSPTTMEPRRVPGRSRESHAPPRAASTSLHKDSGSLWLSRVSGQDGGAPTMLLWTASWEPNDFSSNIRYYFLFVSSLDGCPTSFLPP